MKCYHCKATINPKRNGYCYISYRRKPNGPLHRRYWCAAHNIDSIIDAEAPESWDDAPARYVPYTSLFMLGR